MKNCRFSRSWFSLKTFFSCSPRQAGSKYILFDLERSISKFDLRSCQVKVRSKRKYVNMHIFWSGSTSQVVWHHLRVSISFLSRLIGEKRIVTSFDLRWPPRDPQSSVAPRSAEMGWVAVILKELAGFDRFMRNGKHFHVCPEAYNGEVTKLTWP